MVDNRVTTSIDVYIGSPLEQQSERSFLNRACDDLRKANCAAIILANFYRRLIRAKLTFLL